MPETFCIDIDKKYCLSDFISHLEINFDVQFLEVLKQQYDLNNFTGVIEARIVVVLKHSRSLDSETKKVENSTHLPKENLQKRYQNAVNLENNDDTSVDFDYDTSSDEIDDPVALETNENNALRSKIKFNSSNEFRVSKPLCDQCGQVFHQQRTYIRHMLSAHGETVEIAGSQKPFICSECNLEFPARHALQKHLMEHKGYCFKCSRCKPGAALKFPSYSQLRTHYLKVHMVMKCKHCSEVCYGRLNYNEHLSSSHSELKAEKNSKGELKKYTCPTCQSTFYHASKYEEHLLFQRNNMCFVCPICEKSMRNRKCLKYHMTTHGVGSRKQCELCDRTFAQNSALVQHMRINHPDKLPAKYRGAISCEFCGKVFKNRGSLVQHKQTAHEEVMRRCPKCKRVFTSAAALSNHTHHCL